MANFIFISLLLLIFLSSSMASYESFYNALEAIAASGYLSMAITLEISSKSLHFEETSGTFFAVPDPAFIHSGQPSLLQVLYHITPTRLSPENLKALPLGTRILTLLPHQPLIITSNPGPNSRLSINGVLIQESPLVDDGSIVVYGITDFFNFSSMVVPPNLSGPPSSNHVRVAINGCQTENASSVFREYDDVSPFCEAKELLASRGYSIMAAFLDVQIFGFRKQSKLTIFAPDDEAVEAGGANNMTDFGLTFRQHVVPGFLSWRDLEGFKDGTTLQTLSGGFMINVTKSGDVLILNGVPLVFPDMYYGNSLIVHGLNRLLRSEMKQQVVGVGDSFSDFVWEGGQNVPEYGGEYAEYGAP